MDKLKGLKTLFSKKSKKDKVNDLPSLEKVKEIKKDVRDAMRKLNQQNRMITGKISQNDTRMDKDIDCMTCKKFAVLLNNKEKLNSLTQKQKQGAKVAYTRCRRCKANYCDINKFETMNDLEICSMITSIFDDQEIMNLLEIIN
jgi:hypothetical protein